MPAEPKASEPVKPPDPASVDDLRQRLRSLGYLDAGVDRFVLGSASRARRPARIALSASLRIGILAAVLLGPAAAIGLVSRVPGLITGPRDAVVAAIFLGVLFGACVAAASFLAALLAAWITTRTHATGARLARRARLLSIAAGVIVSAACLAYLTLWWRAAAGEPGWSSPLWTAFALAVAAAISLLLGHAVTVTALAVTMAGSGEDVEPGRAPGMTWKASVGGTAIAFAGAAVLLLATAGESPGQAPAPPPLTVAGGGARVIVLAIDGFDAQMQERLRPSPYTSPAANLFNVLDSARADLAPADSRDPAPLWTTIATGVPPHVHGVEELETRRVTGLRGRLSAGAAGRVLVGATDVLRLTTPAIASTVERRTKTFWEVAEQAGLRTGVVNWWATWPAPATGGVVLSDRAVLRLERGGALDAEIAPAALYEALKGRWPQLREQAQTRAARHLSRGHDGGAGALRADLQAVLARSAALDATVLCLADEIGSDSNLDLVVVYLPGLDIAQHTLLARGGPPQPAELDARLDALQRYYRFVNSLTAELAAGSYYDRVFLVTQPGRLHGAGGILATRGARPDAERRVTGTVMDVTPTILFALGVPASRELEGRVLTDLFNPEVVARHPPRTVDTYGARGAVTAARGAAPLDQEAIERLRSLGYVR